MSTPKSLWTTVIPEVAGGKTKPSLVPYINEYFTKNKRPVPHILNADQMGYNHMGSEIEMLFVQTSIEDWWLITRWITAEYGYKVASSQKVRCYTDRNTYEFIGKTRYLKLMSSPFREKTYLRQYSQNYWGTRVDALFAMPIV